MHLLTLLLPLAAFACKPAPVADCADTARLLLRTHPFDALSSKVKEMQSTLDLALRPTAKGPKKDQKKDQPDCFNSHFADFYLEQAKAYALKHDKLVCPKHIDEISASVSALTDSESAEWRAVKAQAERQKLETEALGVKGTLHDFIVVHSKL